MAHTAKMLQSLMYPVDYRDYSTEALLRERAIFIGYAKHLYKEMNLLVQGPCTDALSAYHDSLQLDYEYYRANWTAIELQLQANIAGLRGVRALGITKPKSKRAA